MSDQRIQYDEEMVGAGHPTKSDTLNRLMLVEHNSDGTHAIPNDETARVKGCGCWTKDGDEFYVKAGLVNIEGVLHAVPAGLTKSVSGLSADDIYYVYCAANAGADLTVTEISVSATAPAWSNDYKALYNGSTRCIGVLYTDASGDLMQSSLAGRYWSFNDRADALTYDGSYPDNSVWTADIGAPALGRLKVNVRAATDGSEFALANGDESSTDFSDNYKFLWMMPGYVPAAHGQFTTDDSQQLVYRCQSVNTMKLYLLGFGLPQCLGSSN